MNNKKTIIYALLILVVFTALAAGIFISGSSSKKSPDFSLPTYDNKSTISLSGLKGKPVFLLFFSTTCPTCVSEAPMLERNYQQYKDRVSFVGLEVNTGPTEVASFVKEKGVTYPIVISDQKTSADYKINGIPDMYFIDKNGNIASRHIGRILEPELKSELNKLI